MKYTQRWPMANDYGNFTQGIKVPHIVEVAIVIGH